MASPKGRPPKRELPPRPASEDDDSSSPDSSDSEDSFRAAEEELHELLPSKHRPFRVTDKLGEGSYSRVYRLQVSGAAIGGYRDLAVKQLRRSKKSASKRAEMEADLLYKLRSHPNIIPLLTTLRRRADGKIRSLIFPNIGKHKKIRTSLRTFRADEVQAFLQTLLKALAHSHSFNIVHRDVKVSNFIVGTGESEGQHFLIDFGLARVVGETKGRKPVADRSGTRGFRSPETLFHFVNQTVAVDVWSAGIVFLCLLAGKYPLKTPADDAEALMQVAELVGTSAMKNAGRVCGKEIHTNVDAPPLHLPAFCATVRHKYKLQDMQVHPNAYHLLYLMLNPDFSTRITAAECLQHPFFAGPASTGVPRPLSGSQAMGSQKTEWRDVAPGRNEGPPADRSINGRHAVPQEQFPPARVGYHHQDRGGGMNSYVPPPEEHSPQAMSVSYGNVPDMPPAMQQQPDLDSLRSPQHSTQSYYPPHYQGGSVRERQTAPYAPQGAPRWGPYDES